MKNEEWPSTGSGTAMKNEIIGFVKEKIIRNERCYHWSIKRNRERIG